MHKNWVLDKAGRCDNGPLCIYASIHEKVRVCVTRKSSLHLIFVCICVRRLYLPQR